MYIASRIYCLESRKLTLHRIYYVWFNNFQISSTWTDRKTRFISVQIKRQASTSPYPFFFYFKESVIVRLKQQFTFDMYVVCGLLFVHYHGLLFDSGIPLWNILTVGMYMRRCECVWAAHPFAKQSRRLAPGNKLLRFKDSAHMFYHSNSYVLSRCSLSVRTCFLSFRRLPTAIEECNSTDTFCFEEPYNERNDEVSDGGPEIGVHFLNAPYCVLIMLGDRISDATSIEQWRRFVYKTLRRWRDSHSVRGIYVASSSSSAAFFTNLDWTKKFREGEWAEWAHCNMFRNKYIWWFHFSILVLCWVYLLTNILVYTFNLSCKKC